MIPMEIKDTAETGRIEAILSDESDWNLFDQIADSIAVEFNGYWIEKLDGLDNRYWDIAIEGIILTLHLEHYLGISLFPKYNEVKAKLLIQKIVKFLETKKL